MLFKRQKKLLALLECFGGSLQNTDLQKYLFLFTRLEKEQSYHFVPYKFGCFSFHAYDDRRKLISKGFLEDCDEWVLNPQNTTYKNMLTYEDNEKLGRIKKDYGKLTGDELVSCVYKKYPYFAINSTIAKRILSNDDLQKVELLKPRKKGTKLFTLGYENRSLEEYLNILIQHNIKLLCDVRKNALSRKYGFSKKTLSNALGSLGIEYIHMPELGIESNFRKNLDTQADYDELFEEYKKNTLNNRMDKVKEICNNINEKKRVALTCFERSPSMCHRTKVANRILAINDNQIKFEEL